MRSGLGLSISLNTLLGQIHASEAYQLSLARCSHTHTTMLSLNVLVELVRVKHL